MNKKLKPFHQRYKDIPVTPNGLLEFPNQKVVVPTEDGKISMRGVPSIVVAKDDMGNSRLLFPEQEYKFPGTYVYECPLSPTKTQSPKQTMQTGGEYDMKRALELGYTPDENGHWPSVDEETGEFLKSKTRPTAWMENLYGNLNLDLAKNKQIIQNERGRLQYVDRQRGGEIPKYRNPNAPQYENPDAYNGPINIPSGPPIPVVDNVHETIHTNQTPEGLQQAIEDLDVNPKGKRYDPNRKPVEPDKPFTINPGRIARGLNTGMNLLSSFLENQDYERRYREEKERLGNTNIFGDDFAGFNPYGDYTLNPGQGQNFRPNQTTYARSYEDGGEYQRGGQSQSVKVGTKPEWLQGARYPYRIKEDDKRDEVIKNFFFALADEANGNTDIAAKNLKALNQGYGSNRGKVPDEYYGFDYADITEESIRRYMLEYAENFPQDDTRRRRWQYGGQRATGIRDLKEYEYRNKMYNDSLKLYEKSDKELADWSKEVKTTIDAYNPLESMSTVAASIGNFFNSGSNGSGNIRPVYSEIYNILPPSGLGAGHKRNYINESIYPTHRVEIGDKKFNTKYEIPGGENMRNDDFHDRRFRPLFSRVDLYKKPTQPVFFDPVIPRPAPVSRPRRVSPPVPETPPPPAVHPFYEDAIAKLEKEKSAPVKSDTPRVNQPTDFKIERIEASGDNYIINLSDKSKALNLSKADFDKWVATHKKQWDDYVKSNNLQSKKGYQYGGQRASLPPGTIPPSQGDSIALYNNTQKLLDYYKNYKILRDSEPIPMDEIELRFYRDRLAKGETTTTPTGERVLPEKEFYKKVDDNRYFMRESAKAVVDTRAPFPLYDKRIQPQISRLMYNSDTNDIMSGDAVALNMYDPIQVKPYKFLTEDEKKIRLQKYGPESWMNRSTPRRTSTSSSTQPEPSTPPPPTVHPFYNDAVAKVETEKKTVPPPSGVPRVNTGRVVTPPPAQEKVIPNEKLTIKTVTATAGGYIINTGESDKALNLSEKDFEAFVATHKDAWEAYVKANNLKRAPVKKSPPLASYKYGGQFNEGDILDLTDAQIQALRNEGYEIDLL